MTTRFLFVLLMSSIVGGVVDAEAQFQPYRAAIGVRAGFADLGGDQFHNLTNGVSFTGFVRAPVGEYFTVEVGASAAAHRETLLCVGFSPCVASRESVVTGLFVAPGVRHMIPRTPLVGYATLQTGLLFGQFQDEGPGAEFGVVIGSAFPVYRNLSGDVSVLGSMVYVGSDVPHSAYGRRLEIRLGFAYALHTFGG